MIVPTNGWEDWIGLKERESALREQPKMNGFGSKLP